MTEGHTHIISVGESIHEILPIALNEYEASRLILVVERSIYEMPKVRKNPQIIQAIEEVKATAKRLRMALDVKVIDDTTIPTIRDAVLEVYENDPHAHHYFNVTSGPKDLSNGLFLMSIWLEGTAYYIREGCPVQRLSVPRIHLDDLRKNPNHLLMLQQLAGHRGSAIPYAALREYMREAFVPIRSKASGKEKRQFNPTLFSRWVTDLERLEMVEVSYIEGSRKEKELTITEDGLFMARFAKASGLAKDR